MTTQPQYYMRSRHGHFVPLVLAPVVTQHGLRYEWCNDETCNSYTEDHLRHLMLDGTVVPFEKIGPWTGYSDLLDEAETHPRRTR